MFIPPTPETTPPVFERRLLGLSRRLQVLSSEVDFALQHLRNDPNASLVRARMALEKLVFTVYERLMSMEPRKRELGLVLTDNQFTRLIDRRILSRMNAVRDMGNLGAHGEPVLQTDASRALQDLSDILEWYIDKFGSELGGVSSVPNGQVLTQPFGPAAIDLGVKICSAVHAELHQCRGSIEAEISVSEPRHGQIVSVIDILCNKAARKVVEQEFERSGLRVALMGEDLPDLEDDSDADVLCCLDSLDGTQHWLRGRNLFCTALSLFRKSITTDGPRWGLAASHVCMADGTIYYASEDAAAAYVHGSSTPMRVRGRPIRTLAEAHVCTVARRPSHFEILLPILSAGSPFSGLYLFGGNPFLATLALGEYDAVFQPDASAVSDSQEVWDWLPGGHIAQRAGCTLLSLDGEPFDVVAHATAAIGRQGTAFPYVAARSAELAHEVARWLRSPRPSC